MIILEAQQLTIKSPTKTIISDLSFQVEQGDFVSVTGPSGSGKSTLLKEIVDLNATNLERQGHILYQGRDTADLSPIDLRHQISYCFQTAQLFGQTVYDNLLFPYAIRQQAFEEEKIIHLLEKVNLSADYLQKDIQSLSGGEKQRVALIRNLIFPPRILLLDEVTSALDSSTREVLWTWLQNYIETEKITTLMISHLESDHQFASQVIHIPHSNHKGGN